MNHRFVFVNDFMKCFVDKEYLFMERNVCDTITVLTDALYLV